MSDHMAWFHEWKTRVRTADAALGVADPVEAARQLCAQVRVTPDQPFAWGQAKRVALRYGDWAKVVRRSTGRSSGVPPSAAELAAEDAALNAVSLPDDEVIDPTDATAMAALATGVGALLAVGDLSPTTAAAIADLPNKREPEFTPPPGENDLITLRGGG